MLTGTGLASDERLIEAARTASEREGWGGGASPLVSGRGESHADLERRLAKFEGAHSLLDRLAGGKEDERQLGPLGALLDPAGAGKG